MTVEQFKELGKICGTEYTDEYAKAMVTKMRLASNVFHSLNERLVRDRKQHLQILSSATRVNGEVHSVFKILNIDTPKYWEYVENLIGCYCETLAEVKRTKTTLIVML